MIAGFPTSAFAGVTAPTPSLGTRMMNYVADHPEVGIAMMNYGGLALSFGVGSLVKAGATIASTHLLGEAGISGAIGTAITYGISTCYSIDAKNAAKSLVGMSVDAANAISSK